MVLELTGHLVSWWHFRISRLAGRPLGCETPLGRETTICNIGERCCCVRGFMRLPRPRNHVTFQRICSQSVGPWYTNPPGLSLRHLCLVQDQKIKTSTCSWNRFWHFREQGLVERPAYTLRMRCLPSRPHSSGRCKYLKSEKVRHLPFRILSTQIFLTHLDGKLGSLQDLT